MGIANGVHHLALSTKDMKKQIEFCTQVCGMELIGLFTMHGTDGCFHCFLKLNDQSYLSFIQTTDMGDKEPAIGSSHPVNVLGGVAPGAMQHVALSVPTQASLLEMRDRIRAAGYQVTGPLGHGISESIYMIAPEGYVLEFTCTEDRAELDPEMWIEPAIVEKCGITKDELARYVNPPEFKRPPQAVAQPQMNSTLQDRSVLPPPVVEMTRGMSDEKIREMLTWEEPPNRVTHRVVL
jgi:catechol 2,3-dioxygenase-like lactoylglutathione lyase family enzyme